MSSHKEEEAKRAINVAEKKLSENDYLGAKKFAYKAQSLHPELNGLNQVLLMIDVYIFGSKQLPDWYGILGVDPTADDEALKRQYKKMALLIHPDKNKFNGAEGATKLVLEAWSVLSDEVKRILYDQKRISKKFNLNKMKKPSQPNPNPNPPEPESHSYPDPEPDLSFRKCKDETFWTLCERCKTYCQFGKNNNLNKNLVCPNCGEDFVATEVPLEEVKNRKIMRFRFFKRYTNRSTSDTSSSSTSASESARDAHYERMRRWFEPELSEAFCTKPADVAAAAEAAAAAGGDGTEEERLFKKMATGNANSCSGAESVFEKPMTTGNADSTLEAERLFKKPMTDVN